MEITGEQTIAAPRDRVWEALNDVEVLRACIPGCESLEQQADGSLLAAVVAKIGPVKARFETGLSLQNVDAPHSYTLVGEGNGGSAGFARGSADVALEAREESTLLRYSAAIQPGGKLAQIGSRLLGGSVRKLSEQFFSRLKRSVEDEASDTPPLNS